MSPAPEHRLPRPLVPDLPSGGGVPTSANRTGFANADHNEEGIELSIIEAAQQEAVHTVADVQAATVGCSRATIAKRSKQAVCAPSVSQIWPPQGSSEL
jgi:hypothetical protein